MSEGARSARRACAALALAFAAAACNDLPEDDPGRIARLRALSIHSEPAEPRPGDAVHLSALIADPAGGRAMTFAWGICLPLLFAEEAGGSELVTAAACARPENRLLLGMDESLDYVIPPQLLDGLTPEDRALGVELPVVFAVAGGGERDFVLKRVRVSESLTPNVNPVVGSFEIDGVDPGAGSAAASWGSSVSLEAGATDEGELHYEYFVSKGTLGLSNVGFAGQPLFWQTRGGAQPPGAFVWVVVRDDRGGTAWAMRRVTF